MNSEFYITKFPLFKRAVSQKGGPPTSAFACMKSNQGSQCLLEERLELIALDKPFLPALVAQLDAQMVVRRYQIRI